MAPNITGELIDVSTWELYYGRVAIDLDIVGAFAEGELDVEEPYPGAVIEIQSADSAEASEVRFVLGADGNRHDIVIADGAYMEGTVEWLLPTGFGGIWESGKGPTTTFAATGEFCATRVTA